MEDAFGIIVQFIAMRTHAGCTSKSFCPHWYTNLIALAIVIATGMSNCVLFVCVFKLKQKGRHRKREREGEREREVKNIFNKIYRKRMKQRKTGHT